MHYRILLALLASLSWCITPHAFADKKGEMIQTTYQPYIQISASQNWVRENIKDQHDILLPNTSNDDIRPFALRDQGIGAHLALGNLWRLYQVYFRGELQINRFNTVQQTINPAFPPPPAGIPAFPNSFCTRTEATSFMLNGYVQTPAKQGFAFYIGGGIGLAHKKNWSIMRMNFAPWPGSDTVYHSVNSLAWQASIGALYELNDKLSINLGWMYHRLGTNKLGTFYSHPPSLIGRNIFGSNVSVHSVQLGLMYHI